MLNIHKLKEKLDTKEKDKIQVYEKILKLCHNRINKSAENLEEYSVYVVPEYYFGLPRYDVMACSDYIVNQLKLNGFNVMYTYPNFIFISWKHVKYDSEKSKEFENSQKAQPKYIDYKTEIQPIYYRRIEDFNR